MLLWTLRCVHPFMFVFSFWVFLFWLFFKRYTQKGKCWVKWPSCFSFFETPPYWCPQQLPQFTLPATVHNCSLFSASTSTFAICVLLDDGHSESWGGISLWFGFAFPWWWATGSIFWCSRYQLCKTAALLITDVLCLHTGARSCMSKLLVKNSFLSESRFVVVVVMFL